MLVNIKFAQDMVHKISQKVLVAAPMTIGLINKTIKTQTTE